MYPVRFIIFQPKGSALLDDEIVPGSLYRFLLAKNDQVEPGTFHYLFLIKLNLVYFIISFIVIWRFLRDSELFRDLI